MTLFTEIAYCVGMLIMFLYALHYCVTDMLGEDDPALIYGAMLIVSAIVAIFWLPVVFLVVAGYVIKQNAKVLR